MLHTIRLIQGRVNGKSYATALPIMAASLSLLVLGITLMWAR
ncbi:MAG: hypothetical protein ABIP02_10230 [Arenimonas sp.]